MTESSPEELVLEDVRQLMEIDDALFVSLRSYMRAAYNMLYLQRTAWFGTDESLEPQPLDEVLATFL